MATQFLHAAVILDKCSAMRLAGEMHIISQKPQDCVYDTETKIFTLKDGYEVSLSEVVYVGCVSSFDIELRSDSLKKEIDELEDAFVNHDHAKAMKINAEFDAKSEWVSADAVSLINELIALFVNLNAFSKKWAYAQYQDIAFRLFNAGHRKESDALYFAWEETTDDADEFVNRLRQIIPA